MENGELIKLLRSIRRYLLFVTCFFFLVSGFVCFIFFVEFIGFDFWSADSNESCYSEQTDNRLTYYDMENNRRVFAELTANGEYEKLLEVSREKLKEYPNDTIAMVAEAHALYKLGDLTQAKEIFLKVIDINPAYKIYVDPYLEKIKEK